MKLILTRGLIGAVICVTGFSVFLMILSGGPAQFFAYHSQNQLGDWDFMLPIFFGGFIAGTTNGLLKVSVRFLLMGILLIPVAVTMVYAMNLTPTKNAAQLLTYVIFPLSASVAMTLPTLGIWILRRLLQKQSAPNRTH